jgi:hypothetical protein
MLAEYFKFNVLIQHRAWYIRNTVANQRPLINFTFNISIFAPFINAFLMFWKFNTVFCTFLQLHFSDFSN